MVVMGGSAAVFALLTAVGADLAATNAHIDLCSGFLQEIATLIATRPDTQQLVNALTHNGYTVLSQCRWRPRRHRPR